VTRLSTRQVRQSAGLLLKNNLKYHYAGATPELRQYIKVGSTPRLRYSPV